MNETYEHHYTDTGIYTVKEKFADGSMRTIDFPLQSPAYLDWCNKNTPKKVSANRFITISNDTACYIPEKDAILLAEETARNDERLRKEVADIDWKVLRYIRQERLVSKGKMTKSKQSEAEFIAMLEYQQSLTDQISDPKIDVSINPGE